MSNDLQRRASNVRAEIIFMRPGAIQLTASTANLSTQYVERLKAIEGVEDALPIIRTLLPGRQRFWIEQIDGVEWENYATDERHSDRYWPCSTDANDISH